MCVSPAISFVHVIDVVIVYVIYVVIVHVIYVVIVYVIDAAISWSNSSHLSTMIESVRCLRRFE